MKGDCERIVLNRQSNSTSCRDIEHGGEVAQVDSDEEIVCAGVKRCFDELTIVTKLIDELGLGIGECLLKNENIAERCQDPSSYDRHGHFNDV